ncbi:MAG: maleylpyruvate isomerase N-terminal domain-containing protein [Nocardioidaceae bacterium]
MGLGTTVFLDTVDRLDDESLSGPSGLPGWTRAHVVAHVHHNAEALQRLLHWARTGEATPMYESAAARDAEIEHGAALPPAELRKHVHTSAGQLSTAVDTLPDKAWGNQVRTAQGRTVPASEVVWMRTREVAVHAVDLTAGVSFGDLPDDLNSALVKDAVDKRVGRGEAAVLAEWLTGRTAAAPLLGPWL